MLQTVLGVDAVRIASAFLVSPADGLAALEEIPASRIVNYQPYWAAGGHLLKLLNRKDEAQKRSLVPRA
jgi:predicted RNA polymerase sigma factor